MQFGNMLIIAICKLYMKYSELLHDRKEGATAPQAPQP
jgi:hypothetical protein